MLKLALVLTLACPAPIFLNESTEPFNEGADLSAITTAVNTCKTRYSPDNPCLKKFIKRKPQVYWAICGPLK